MHERQKNEREHRGMMEMYGNASDRRGPRDRVLHGWLVLHESANGRANGCVLPVDQMSKQLILARYATYMVVMASHCKHSE